MKETKLFPFRKGRVYKNGEKIYGEVVYVTAEGERIENRWSGFSSGDEASEYLLEGCLVRFVDREDL